MLSAGLQLAALYIEPLPRLLRVAPLDAGEWAVVAGCAAIPAVVGQALKIRRQQL